MNDPEGLAEGFWRGLSKGAPTTSEPLVFTVLWQLGEILVLYLASWRLAERNQTSFVKR